MYTVTPSWDTGRPQSAFAGLAEAGAWRGQLLDIGCGTGEHVLLAASLGLDATGIDQAPAAIARAQAKAADRGLSARFLVHDALDVAALGDQFESVLDCRLFHVLSDEAGVSRIASTNSAGTQPRTAVYETNLAPGRAQAWLATITKT